LGPTGWAFPQEGIALAIHKIHDRVPTDNPLGEPFSRSAFTSLRRAVFQPVVIFVVPTICSATGRRGLDEGRTDGSYGATDDRRVSKPLWPSDTVPGRALNRDHRLRVSQRLGQGNARAAR